MAETGAELGIARVVVWLSGKHMLRIFIIIYIDWCYAQKSRKVFVPKKYKNKDWYKSLGTEHVGAIVRHWLGSERFPTEATALFRHDLSR